MKLDALFGDSIAIGTLFLFCIFIFLFIMPFNVIYGYARKELFKTLAQIIISPFGLVKFRHFFLADLLTSFV